MKKILVTSCWLILISTQVQPGATQSSVTGDLLDKRVFHFLDDMAKIPDGPGLGIEINEGHVREMARTGHDWKNPLWRHRDGSVAEW